jgi:hypothetical protein
LFHWVFLKCCSIFCCALYIGFECLIQVQLICCYILLDLFSRMPWRFSFCFWNVVVDKVYHGVDGKIWSIGRLGSLLFLNFVDYLFGRICNTVNSIPSLYAVSKSVLVLLSHYTFHSIGCFPASPYTSMFLLNFIYESFDSTWAWTQGVSLAMQYFTPTKLFKVYAHLNIL